MPCNSDYMEPNHREKELQRAAKLLVYVREKTGQECSVEKILTTCCGLLAYQSSINTVKLYIQSLCSSQNICSKIQAVFYRAGQEPEEWAVKEADNAYVSDESSVTRIS